MNRQDPTRSKSVEDTVLGRIRGAQSELLPQVEGSWTPGPWRIFIVHDPCHDDDEDEDYRSDRNTVIALHDEEGIWRIIGRELDQDLALKIARGEH